MAKPGAVPRSVILLVVLLAQFGPQTLKSVSAARYAPAVVSHDREETGRTWGASFVPRDIGAAGWKLERRLSDDREELSTHGAAHEDTGNQVKTNGRPQSPHGYHHQLYPSNGRDDQSWSRSSCEKGGDGGGCRGGQGGQGSEGDGSKKPSGDEIYGGHGWDGRDSRDGGWTMDTYAKRSQFFFIYEGNGGNGNGNGLGGECGLGGLSDGRGPGGKQLGSGGGGGPSSGGESRGGSGDGHAPGGGRPSGGKPGR